LCVKGVALEFYLKKYGNGLFILIAVVAIIPNFLYDTVLNAPYHWAFKYLSIPIFGLSFYVYFYKLPKFRRKAGNFKGFAWTSMVAALLLLFSGGYVLFFNAWVGSQKEVYLSGTVVELDTYKSTKGGMSYYVYVLLPNSDEPVKLDVSKSHFNTFKVGSEFKEVWIRGSLGILYHRR
ncbi:hypothetical protein, partial [Shewanella xiamenensis]